MTEQHEPTPQETVRIAANQMVDACGEIRAELAAVAAISAAYAIARRLPDEMRVTIAGTMAQTAENLLTPEELQDVTH